MFQELIRKGGIGWMMPLLLLAWVGLALTLERLWWWGVRLARQRRAAPALEGLISGRTPAADWEPALARVQRVRDATVGVMTVFLANLYRERVPLAIAETRARDQAAAEVAASRRFLDVLSHIANLSGTLGLLGTVAGISMSFEALTVENPKGLSMSLATALFTTVAGIFIFLPSYLAVFVYSSLSDALEARLDTHLTRMHERCQIEGVPAEGWDLALVPAAVEEPVAAPTNGTCPAPAPAEEPQAAGRG